MGDMSDYSGLNDSKAIEITGKVMVIAIISLFVVVVAVLFLHLYARWFWWRVMEEPPRHERSHSLRRRRRRFVFIPDDNITLARRGLDPVVLHSIPVVVYNPEDIKEGLECSVCLSDVAEGEKVRILPKCSHGFHVECIDMWFQSHATCPLCRNSVMSEHNGSNDAAGGRSIGIESSSDGEDVSETEPDVEASRLPVNVLFWGDETRVSSRTCPTGGTNPVDSPSFSQESSSSGGGIRLEREEPLVIEIPRRMIEDMESSLSPSTSGCPPDGLKSPVTGRLRSFRRLLSRERRVSSCSPNGAAAAAVAAIDMERGDRNTNRPS